MKLSDRPALSLARICLVVAVFAMTPFTTRVQAQLFDGLPDPSMDQYASMWETITGYDYVEGASSLFLGYEVGGNTDTFELVAFQPAQDGGTETIATVVGTVTVLELYPYQWLLPYHSVYDMDSGSDQFQFSVDRSMSAAAVLIASDTGIIEFGVTGVCETTIEILSGTGDGVNIGETATYRVLVPLGFVDDPLEAAEIAQRIADMDIYDGDPIDPNASGNMGLVVSDPDRQTKCDSEYATDRAICKNIFKGELGKCPRRAGGAAIGGCLAGTGVCALIPPPIQGAAICCAGGAIVGGIAGLYVCVADAQDNFDGCMRNALLDFRLCKLLSENDGSNINP